MYRFPDQINPHPGILTSEQVDLIKDHSNVVTFNKRDIIFKQNTRTSHVMFIISGMVKIFKEGKNQKVLILNIGTPGHFLGLISIFGEDTFTYSASAIVDTEILFIDINVFKELLEENGAYGTYLLKKMSLDNLYVFDRLMSQSQKQLPGRVADIILYFSQTIYNSLTFEFPLTRNELAELAGTTKESLIRTLTEFRNDKIIKLDNKHVEIQSLEIVKTLSRIG